ncbi:5-oxoprolinase subunit PxpA [Brooklawnia cerclae]|uniref:5-oxoprolinase subunit A n=1 Tax=Brooklawnia cerclae TaxID=349934 RepID=A0ABX0SAU1_9ACTN|nr:5-oxoprolinase subunit PxpA [Brooklawnia cerclae]NIH55449.1 UPF0271 protein [Brooklawnia cerclae]
MTEPVARVDLNSDVGESFGRWTLDDAAMLTTVSSANIACGFHAGDPSSIRRSLTVAAANGVTVGAHVGYRDLVGFGRRDLDVDTPDLIADVIYQIGALQALAVGAGTRVSYVKPHGALYNRIVHDERQAEAVVTAITELDPSLVLLGLPGSVVLHLAERAGVPTATEAFADRAYTPEGKLVSRRVEGSVLHDPELIAGRILRLVETGTITAIDGTEVRLHADSICVHGDTDGAVEAARALRARLTGAGVRITAFAGA